MTKTNEEVYTQEATGMGIAVHVLPVAAKHVCAIAL